MATDEIGLLWRQLEVLHAAVSDLIGLQRTALCAQAAALPGGGPAVRSALGQVIEQLDALRDRLRPYGEEAGERVARAETRRPRLGEIDVARINVIEPDGTQRMVIFNGERIPDLVVDGRTLARREGGDGAGIIFYNTEGDECGGLVFGGKSEDGRYGAGSALLFDQFKQDQTIGLVYEDENGRRSAGLAVWDRPNLPISEQVERHEAIQRMPEGPEREEALGRLWAGNAQRVYVGRTEDGSAVLHLRDRNGTARLRLVVDADGAPRLEFLDERGRASLTLPDPITRDAPTADLPG